MVQSRACAPGLCVCVGNMSYYDKVSTCSDNQGDLPGRRSLLVKEELELFAWWPDRYFPLYLTYKFLPKAIRKAEGKCAFHVITHLVHPSDSSQISQPWQRSSSEAALSPRKVLLSLCLGFCLGILGRKFGAVNSGKYTSSHCAGKSVHGVEDGVLERKGGPLGSSPTLTLPFLLTHQAVFHLEPRRHRCSLLADWLLLTSQVSA